jgi:hypothetical protein
MTIRAFFFNRLNEDGEGEDHERRVREVDHRTARSIAAIVSNEVVSVEGPVCDAGIPHDYIELVEITDVDADPADLPGREEYVARIRAYVGPADAVVGTVIESPSDGTTLRRPVF